MSRPIGRLDLGLVTRIEAAEILGASETTMRRHQKAGRLRVVGQSARKEVLFARVDVLKLARTSPIAKARRRARSSSLQVGEVAAIACEMFRSGRSIVDVVVRTRSPFAHVEMLHEQWAQSDGLLLLDVRARQRLEALLGRRLKDGADLVRTIGRLLEQARAQTRKVSTTREVQETPDATDPTIN